MGGKSTSTTSSNAEPWGPIQPNLKHIAKEGKQLYNQGGFSAEPYGGDRIAGFGNVSNRAQNKIVNMSRGPNYANKAARALNGVMNADEYDLEAVKNNALGSAIPAATSMFSGSGLADSSMAMDTVGRAALEAVAPYEYDAYNQQQSNIMQAAGMMPAINEARYAPAKMAQSIGIMRDMMRQSRIDSNMAKYYEGQGQEMENLQGYTNLLNPLATMGGSSNSTTTQSSSPGFGEILGTGLQLFGLFSDRRTKENIAKIGEHNGHNIYSYNYLWAPTIEVGVMADEVPHAVCGDVAGYAVVDYARL